MEFGEKLRARRTELGMSQGTLAQKSGLSLRSIQNYEGGSRHPGNIAIVKRMAEALDTGWEYLLDDTARYVIDAGERGGESAAADMDKLLSELHGLFAGGRLSQGDKDKVIRAINEIYWETKEEVK